MATLTQQPNQWNLAYAPNIYTLDNLGAADRYVIKVYKGNVTGELLATFKTSPNPSGVAHFDVSKVLQSQLEASYNEATTSLAETPNAVITYQVAYGTETNGIYLQDDATSIKHALNGYADWRTINWDWTDYIPNPNSVACLCEGPECEVPFNADYTRTYSFLTNWPTVNESGIKKYKVRSDEYKTLSFFTRIYNWNNGTMWGPNEAPFFIKNTFRNAAGSTLAIDIRTISTGSGLDIRTNCQDYSTHSYTDGQLIATFGVGPQNIKDSAFPWYNCASYTTEIYSINGCYINDNGFISDCEDYALLDEYLGDVIYQAEFIIDDYCQKFEPITLSFMNAFGVRDYYTFNKRNTYTTNITRNNYKQQIGSWSDATWSIDPVDRGRRTFSTMATTQMTVSSDWMTDDESKWLEELFVSPSVLAYIDGNWEPTVVMSTEYQQMTSARNGLFQHEITLQFANDKNIQRG